MNDAEIIATIEDLEKTLVKVSMAKHPLLTLYNLKNSEMHYLVTNELIDIGMQSSSYATIKGLLQSSQDYKVTEEMVLTCIRDQARIELNAQDVLDMLLSKNYKLTKKILDEFFDVIPLYTADKLYYLGLKKLIPEPLRNNYGYN